MIIVDNVVPVTLFQRVKNIICHKDTPWYFSATYDEVQADEKQDILNFHWSHFAYKNDQQVSNLFEPLFNIFLFGLEKANLPFNKLIRIRLGQLNGVREPYHNIPHIDVNTPHKVALLYLHNSTASTQMYKEIFDPSRNYNSKEYLDKVLKNKVTLVDTVESKENRMLFFDGFQYHSSSRPTDCSRRIVVNFNYL